MMKSQVMESQATRGFTERPASTHETDAPPRMREIFRLASRTGKTDWV